MRYGSIFASSSSSFTATALRMPPPATWLIQFEVLEETRLSRTYSWKMPVMPLFQERGGDGLPFGGSEKVV